MSHTISRGYHTAKRWRTVAITVEEYLGNLGNSSTAQIGALIALEKFLGLVLEGLEKEPRRSPLMAGICALSIAYKVNNTVKGKRISLYILEKETRNYLNLIRNLKENRQTNPDVVRELRRFLTELARQGTL